MSKTRLWRRVATSVVMGLGLSVMAIPSGASPARVTAPPAIGVVPDLGSASYGWLPVLDENFNGTSIDQSVWEVAHGDLGGLKNRAAVSVSGGELQLRTYSENGPSCGGSGQPACKHRGGAVSTSGFFDPSSRNPKFEAAYGYVEAKIKLHELPDMYSAFWMMSRTGQSQPLGDQMASGPEFDILDYRGFDKTGAAGGGPDGLCDGSKDEFGNPFPAPCSDISTLGFNWDGFGEEHKVEGRWVKNPTPSVPLQDNWHIYSMLWTPDGYRIYWDGIEMQRGVTPGDYTPHHILLTQHQIGPGPAGGYGALGTSGNAVTSVDYVKVWQRPISEIQDQTVAASTPITVPFSVTDFAYTDRTRNDPGTVRVTASSGTPSMVDDNDIVVTGNGPADPGTLTNSNFESGTGSWTIAGGTAMTWGTRKHDGSSSLRLAQSGGRVTQSITGLRPNTTYVVSGFYNLELAYSDTHGTNTNDVVSPGGDGRLTWIADVAQPGQSQPDGKPQLNEMEPLTAGDTYAMFDWGIEDADSTLTGLQTVARNRYRSPLDEVTRRWWSPHNDDWVTDSVIFTTGPDTTSAKVFIDNMQHAGSNNDSDLSFDDITVQPLIPANRAVTVRPTSNQTGSTVITLTATNSANVVLGTEQFTVNLQRGSYFTNGNFEQSPAGVGWDLWDGDTYRGVGADIVVDDPFRLNKVLRLAYPQWDNPNTPANPDVPGAVGTAVQRVTGLKPGTSYTLSIKGKGNIGFSVTGHGGQDPCLSPPAPVDACKITTSGWSTKTLPFTTGSSNTTANINIVDWNPGENPVAESYVDDVSVTPTGSVTANVVIAPEIVSLTELRIPSSAPTGLHVGSAGITVNGITSSNLDLVPNANVAVVGTSYKALSITPVRGRTGITTLAVAYTEAGVAKTKNIKVVVSDDRLVNPGFDSGTPPWGGGLTVGLPSTHSGTGAIQTNGSTPISQIVTGLPQLTNFRLGGWVNGGVKVDVSSLLPDGPDADTAPDRQLITTANWTSTGWTTESSLQFMTKQVSDSGPTSWAPVELVFTDLNTGDGPSTIDDLSLIHGPAMTQPRDVSLHQGQTAFNWDTGPGLSIGRVPSNPAFNPAVLTVSSGNLAVLPAANVRPWFPGLGVSAFSAQIQARAKTAPAPAPTTGRSDVTAVVTDPTTGATTSRTFTVTLNAGNSFNNGDFERNQAGWANTWFSDEKIKVHNEGSTYDGDKALFLSKGGAAYRVTGLEPNTQYILRGRARGTGSSLQAYQPGTDPAAMWSPGPLLAEAPVTDRTQWVTYQVSFWTPSVDNSGTPLVDESREVWITLWDVNANDGANTEPWACDTAWPTNYLTGATCFDDIGFFKFGDNP